MRSAMAAIAATLVAIPCVARGDEGFWTHGDIPYARIEEALGFAPDQAWLDHARLASVRLDGCSASIVSRNGLMQTNHHCVQDCIESLSAPGQDLDKTPILAPTPADERACPAFIAEVLVAYEDVTARVKAAGDG